jgi:hypothetical protein
LIVTVRAARCSYQLHRAELVSLELSELNRADARNALHKARLLPDVINEFTAAFEHAVAEVHPDLD